MFDTELLAADLPPRVPTVEGLIYDGVTLVGGPPKGGKSKLMEQLAQDIVHRKPLLGNPGWPTRLGHVTYITKDDVWNTAQDRLAQMLRKRGELPTGLLNIQTEWPSFDQGGLEQIERTLQDFPDTSAVILDTLALLAPLKVRYANDYTAIHELSQLGHKYQTAIICVMHTNKSGFHRRSTSGRPWHSDIHGSGTAGADTIIGVDRIDKSPTGTLLITGKGIDSGAMPLKFEGGMFSLGGELGEIPDSRELSDHRQDILDVVSRAPQGLTPLGVAARIPGKSYDNLKTTLWRMSDDGQLENFGGCYFTPENLEALKHPPDPQLSFEEVPDPVSRDGRAKFKVVEVA